MRQVLASAADKLGISQDDLMQDLKSGKSLADIAQSKGVSHDDLVSAVAQGLEQNAPPGATSADATKIAERIVDRTPGAGRPEGPPPGGMDRTDTASRALQMLDGTDPDDPTQSTGDVDLADLITRLKTAPGDVQQAFQSGLGVDETA
jgi:hypothetical protein